MVEQIREAEIRSGESKCFGCPFLRNADVIWYCEFYHVALENGYAMQSHSRHCNIEPLSKVVSK